MPGASSIQNKNAQMESLLSGKFQRRHEPNFAHANAISIFSMLPALRAFWPLSAHDTSGGVLHARDIACGYQLTMANNPKFGYSGIAPQVDFDGVNQYGYYADDQQFDIIGNETYVAVPGLTLGGWFRFDVLGSVGVTNRPCITKWQTANQHSYALLLRDTSNLVEFFVTTDGSTTVLVSSAADVVINQWYFLVGRFVPSTSLDLWKNGVKTTNGAGVPATLFDSTSQLEIGRFSAAQYLNGQASLCFICASALPDVLINHLFHQTRALFGVRG